MNAIRSDESLTIANRRHPVDLEKLGSPRPRSTPRFMACGKPSLLSLVPRVC
jgi:hypothetical protein